eukprot:1193627-Prorocentrum_minimum.AAC.2
MGQLFCKLACVAKVATWRLELASAALIVDRYSSVQALGQSAASDQILGCSDACPRARHVARTLQSANPKEQTLKHFGAIYFAPNI